MKRIALLICILCWSAHMDAQSTGFCIQEISDKVFERIYGHSFKEDCTVDREELRYLQVLHYDFQGQIAEGELICHESISKDLLEIFQILFENRYPIESIRLIDEFDADDTRSMQANNSSCFNFRRMTGSTRVSKHGYGLAIDINPLYNPYVKEKSDGKMIIEPAEGAPYADRDNKCPYIIRKGDICYQTFISRGFRWGGDWKTLKDYQHFEK